MKKVLSIFTAFLLSFGILTGTTVVTEPLHASAATKHYSLKVTSSTLNVRHGQYASVTVKGAPKSKGQISVYYKSGRSKAAGLQAKKSTSKGYITWKWKVGTRTTPGTYNVYISLGGKKITAHLHVR
ncbi:hypothetical protein G4D61_10205 [Bacillus ginsengihumi]|uniref:Uncharacterized protein n=1 Tax=Heyndrickxia ginsengihumi TaxID=363870 RepID=A0A6M0P732_9BACI|nr:hypothetical protein [Heyndrickxia ginsengihumi]MCM3023518.1 hypothetical protein [Heyndrickxia ginsengihumi]NEY20327.1 hypothetical protein [Heyndrickxia ginsengihumi]